MLFQLLLLPVLLAVFYGLARPCMRAAVRVLLRGLAPIIVLALIVFVAVAVWGEDTGRSQPRFELLDLLWKLKAVLSCLLLLGISVALYDRSREWRLWMRKRSLKRAARGLASPSVSARLRSRFQVLRGGRSKAWRPPSRVPMAHGKHNSD